MNQYDHDTAILFWSIRGLDIFADYLTNEDSAVWNKKTTWLFETAIKVDLKMQAS